MKPTLLFFFLSTLALSAQANTCVCVASNEAIQDYDAYAKCLAEFPSRDPNSDSSCTPTGDEDRCSAEQAIEQAREQHRQSCETNSFYKPVELILIADGVKLTLETFKSKNECRKELKSLDECK